MNENIDDLIAQLSVAQPSLRTGMDRYRDFREVFLDSDAGKRVLYDILAFCHMWQSSAVRGDPHETYRREGERYIGLKILATTNVEPKERPTKQVTKEG